MTRRFPVHRIKRHRIYDAWEAAEVLGCHRQTVIRWIKDRGLPADTSRKPWLIRGADLKAFLGARQSKRRQKMALHELFCFGCKVPREPAAKMADYSQETQTTGQLTALCPECSTIMHKKIRRADLETIRARIDVTVQQADPRLVSRNEPRLSVNLKKRAKTHG